MVFFGHTDSLFMYRSVTKGEIIFVLQVRIRNDVFIDDDSSYLQCGYLEHINSIGILDLSYRFFLQNSYEISSFQACQNESRNL